MKRALWFFVLLAALLIPAGASAQRLELNKNWEVGDKLTYNLVMRGRPMRFVQEVTEVTDAEIRIAERVDERVYDTVYSARDMSVQRGICLTDGQACTFSPALLWADFPLEKGKTWSGRMAVTGEWFTSENVYQNMVEGVEKIVTPAGRFDAYKVSTTGQYKWTSKSQTRGSATERYAGWWATINDKVVRVKAEYENSTGETYSWELVSAELK